MKKRFLTALLAVSMVVTCIFGLNACSNAESGGDKPKEEVTAPVDGTEEEIINLQQQIADLQEQIKKLTGKVNDSETENKKLSDEIKKLEAENKKLSDRLSELERQNSLGDFYTLQEAYDKGLLTQTDLKNIAYYHNSGIKWAEEYIPKDFVPAPKIPEVLSEETEGAIKQTFWNKYIGNAGSDKTTLDDIGVGESYYGTYNNCVAVMVWCSGSYSDVVDEIDIAGVRFCYTNINKILIWVPDTQITESLDKRIELEIKTAYANKHNYSIEKISLSFYGEYNGAYAVYFIVSEVIYLPAKAEETIDGITFIYPTSNNIIEVYYGGNFYSLRAAYDSGYLNHDNLAEIKKRTEPYVK